MNASIDPSPRTSTPAWTLGESRCGPDSSNRATTSWTGSKRRIFASTGWRGAPSLNSLARARSSASASSNVSNRVRLTRGPERTVSRQGTPPYVRSWIGT